MSRQGWTVHEAGRLALLLTTAWTGGVQAQPVSPPMANIVMAEPVEAATAPGVMTPTPMVPPTQPLIPPDVQIVRFQGPTGVRVEVLGPQPEAAPIGDGHGLATVGLRVGVGYQLRLSNLPNRPGVELYPYVEIVGHLHRPPNIDPARYPIRIPLTEDDIEDVVVRGRMVTLVVYLEDPEQAVALPLPADPEARKRVKDEVTTVTLNPVEPPLKIASALGRIMAVVRIGSRAPGPEDLTGAAIFSGSGLLPMPAGIAAGGRCPFTIPQAGPCSVPCGPISGTPPQGRPWLPKDEFLCDGGDFGSPAGLSVTGDLSGIDPRDAVITFSHATAAELRPEFEKLQNRIAAIQAEMDGLLPRLQQGAIDEATYHAERARLDGERRRVEIEEDRLSHNAAATRRPRVLPTNMVCIYAPRFAAVRVGTGPGEAYNVAYLRGAEIAEQQVTTGSRVGPQRLTRNQTAEINRHRSRPSALVRGEGIGRHSEVRVLGSADVVVHLGGNVKVQGPEVRGTPTMPHEARNRLRLDGIKSAEGLVVTGLVQGAGEQVMAWKPQELATVEQPPNRPGLAIVKQVDQSEAEPGDVVTYTITYRNMGNVPITSVSVVDSLLPRLEYVSGSAKGPEGAVFTASENHAGSQELRWDIGTVAPGQQGAVSFQAAVR